jgi:hypothetical protein
MANSLGHIDLTFCAGNTRGRPPSRVLAVTRRGVLIIASYASRCPARWPPVPGVTYVASLDVGVVNDRTVLAVMHVEETGTGRRVMLDSIDRWQGSRSAPASARRRRLSGADRVLLRRWPGYY